MQADERLTLPSPFGWSPRALAPIPFHAGPVYKLAFGPRSFIVVSDPVMAKHVLKSSVGDYDKGVLATVSAFFFLAIFQMEFVVSTFSREGRLLRLVIVQEPLHV